MPSSTDAVRGSAWRETVRAVADVRVLVAFRGAAVRGRSRLAVRVALGLILLLTATAAWVPAYLPGAAGAYADQRVGASEVLVLLPSIYLGVLLIAVFSAATSGGGRELLPRDQGVAFPVSPTTDHLGALLMAPLNIAWLLQCWLVLGATAFVVGPVHLWAAQAPVVLWLVLATALAQLASWVVEWLRRGRYGVSAVRSLLVLVVVVPALLVGTDRLGGVLDRAPTVQVVLGVLHGSAGTWGAWGVRVALLATGVVAVVAAGAFAAHLLAARPARDELRLETKQHAPVVNPASDLVAVLRVDRAGIWRSVPLRRGFTVLALLPGTAALGAGMEWSMLNILPGLVASACALLYGVNTWALDGRGALWRESLPVSPGLSFLARVVVLTEMLLLAVGLALGLALLRSGPPTVEQAVAVVCSATVVTLQVVAGAMRWSLRRPYSVDLRSARATPAPPLAMVGYSTRLALVTTTTGMLFVATSRLPDWRLSVLVAVPFLLVSTLRLLRTADLWARPAVRSHVVTTVAA